MNPSSAIALVSAMLGAAIPLALSFFSACEIESSLPHATMSVVAAMRRAKVMNLEDAGLMIAFLQKWKGRCCSRESLRPGKRRALYLADATTSPSVRGALQGVGQRSRHHPLWVLKIWGLIPPVSTAALSTCLPPLRLSANRG